MTGRLLPLTLVCCLAAGSLCAARIDGWLDGDILIAEFVASNSTGLDSQRFICVKVTQTG